jgi:hypothetical protein
MTRAPARLLGLLVCLHGCASTPAAAVRDTASAELGCPVDEIRVEDQGESHFVATGCGQRARYATHPPGKCKRPACPLAEH